MKECHDPRHETPCPQPCVGCAEECDPTHLHERATPMQGDMQGDRVLHIANDQFEAIGAGRIMGPPIVINGVSMHLEGIAVKMWKPKGGGTLQVEKYGENADDFNALSQLVSDGHLQTMTWKREQYVLFLTPYTE